MDTRLEQEFEDIFDIDKVLGVKAWIDANFISRQELGGKIEEMENTDLDNVGLYECEFRNEHIRKKDVLSLINNKDN